LSNLKITLYWPGGEPVPGELFAKVLGDDPSEMATRVVLRFTSVSQGARDFLDRARRRYEYHTINRSVQL
jgi:hypothetical protein